MSGLKTIKPLPGERELRFGEDHMKFFFPVPKWHFSYQLYEETH